MSNDHELLSKKQVMDEYGYPEDQLDKDLAADKIPYFTSSGERPTPTGHGPYGGRYYIPRFGVEKRIRELVREGSR